MDMTTEATNRISLIPKRFCKYSLLGFHKSSVSNSFEICEKKIDSVCDNLALRNCIFSALCVLKTKYRNRLDVEADVLLCSSKSEDRFQKLADAKQAQLSH